jgi:hypothetical protein
MEVERGGVEQHHREIGEQAAPALEQLLLDQILGPPRRPGRSAPIRQDLTQPAPPNATQWSVRSMATAAGISYSSVQRIWHAHELKPHLTRSFKVSRDPNFVEKAEDVGWPLPQLNPPNKALVLSIDEYSEVGSYFRSKLHQVTF